MSNSFLTIDMITNEALVVLENNLTFTKGVNRSYDDKFGEAGAKIGNTLNIRKPVQYIGRTGAALSTEDITESEVALTLSTQRGVDVNFSTADLKLSIDEFSDRIIKPGVANVANGVDADGLALYKSVFSAVGTPGSGDPTDLKTYLQGGAYLMDHAAPQDGRVSCVISSWQQVAIVDALTTLLQPAKEISEQYRTGNMGLAAGYKWSMDQNCPTHTVGKLGGTPLVDGASQTGSSLATKGWTDSVTGLLAVGDIFTIAGVYTVNPQNRVSTTKLQQFVVTAAANSDSSGDCTVSISPSIVTSGQYQTVSGSPADGAAITVLGGASDTSKTGLIYHEDAFVLGCADLPVVRGVDMFGRVSDSQTGLSIRMIRAYDINNDNLPCRLDLLYGWAAVRPELACRVHS